MRRTSALLVIAVDVVVRLLGLAFVWAGGMKLEEPTRVVQLFRSWGLGESLIGPASWVEIALGLALFHPPTRRLGAVGMTLWMLFFGGLQIRAGQLAAATASGVVLLTCLAALVTNRIPGWIGSPLERLPVPLRRPPDGAMARSMFLLRIVGLSFLIRWAIGGVLFWVALPVLAWAHARRSEGRDGNRVEATLLYLLVLGIGVSGVWSFVGHYLMSDRVAATIGWAAGSPFQHELAFYHLGVGLAGLACLWIRDRFWLAVGVIPSVFLYGAGSVHLQSYLTSGNVAPGNWSFPMLFGDLIVPTALLLLLAVRRRSIEAPSAIGL